MLTENTNKKRSFKTLIAIFAVLLTVVVLENISDYIPGVSPILYPTSQLFTVL